MKQEQQSQQAAASRPAGNAFWRSCPHPGTTARFNAISKDAWKARHVIENFFKLKQSRAIATRYGKTARKFLTAIQLAAAIIRLNRGQALIFPA